MQSLQEFYKEKITHAKSLDSLAIMIETTCTCCIRINKLKLQQIKHFSFLFSKAYAIVKEAENFAFLQPTRLYFTEEVIIFIAPATAMLVKENRKPPFF